MSDWSQIGDNFKNFFSAENMSSHWLSYILQFLLLAVAFYYVFKILTDNHARKFIAVIIAVVVFCGLAFLFSGFLPEMLLIVIVMVAVVVYSLFSTEVKRSLLDTGYGGTVDTAKRTDVQKHMDEILRAVHNMSIKKIGAFIILSNISSRELPKGVVESGTTIDADITSQLIEAVFYPNAPLHDGALIIENEKILAAGCFVNTLQCDDVPVEFGSRHRAALSIVAVCPVAAIIVSEETGTTTLVDRRCNSKTFARIGGMDIKYKRWATDEDLKEALMRIYWEEDFGGARK